MMIKATGLILLTSLAMSPAAFSTPAGTLSIHILNQQTGMPSPNVSVTLEKQQQTSFFPEIPMMFTVTKTNEKLHNPLQLSQYGYSTYRES